MYAFQLLLVYLNVPMVTYRKTKEEHFPIDQQTHQQRHETRVKFCSKSKIKTLQQWHVAFVSLLLTLDRYLSLGSTTPGKYMLKSTIKNN